MAPITIQDIEETLTATTKRWEYEITDAARRWKALGSDNVVKDFVRQVAFSHLRRQLDNDELDAEFLKVDVVYALMEAMVIVIQVFQMFLFKVDTSIEAESKNTKTHRHQSTMSSTDATDIASSCPHRSYALMQEQV
ncbi:hypothetical protein H0H93_012784 [Arthromyces matolae]|nr:hypothetical protein H0H93_012784 [Arthromyces matolae]